MEVSLQGKLKSFRFPEILNFFSSSQKTGTLNVQRPPDDVQVYFKEGCPIYATSNQERMRLAGILLRRKRIQESEYKQIDSMMENHVEKFGRIAVDQGILTEEELYDFLKIQVSEIIYDCFLWDDGVFDFVDLMQLPESAVTISIDLPNLIMEGARRIQEAQHLQQLLPEKYAVLRLAGSPEERETIALSLDEWKTLFLINGKRTLAEICSEAAASQLETYRVLYGLYANRLVEVVPDEEVNALQSETLEDLPSSEVPTRKIVKDTGLLVSPEANLSYKDVLKITLARLTVMDKGPKAQIFPLIEQEYFIGRQIGIQIHVSDPSISNVHARVFKGPEGYVIEDLNSRNGTFVNGKQIDRRVLQENDVVRIGNTQLVYNIVYEVKRLPSASVD